MAAPSLFNLRSHSVRAFLGRLSRSRFFTISLALHVLFVLTFGSAVLIHQAAQKSDFDDTSGGLVASAPATAPDPVQPLTAPTDLAVNAASLSAPSLTAITSAPLTPTSFTLPSAPPTLAPTTSRVLSNDTAGPAVSAPAINGIPMNVARGMKNFTNSWRAPGDSGSGAGKDRAFKFTAYLAKYSDGDWDSTVRVTNGKIVSGSLPNLLYLIRHWSNNKIDAETQALPLDLAGDDLFAIKPPFILFTGHKDFRLTEKEVENLNKYVQLGGAIWGDSSLPGSRSRFDIAFRREMKRVLPDQDKPWEILPANHPLFTKSYYPDLREAPAGMNYYQEPVYALKWLDEVAVLYTTNDYCDMWQVGLNEQGDYDTRRDQATGAFVAIDYDIYFRRETYFRNLDLKPLTDSYRFGTNIVLHLLTRWDDKLRNVPTGL